MIDEATGGTERRSVGELPWQLEASAAVEFMMSLVIAGDDQMLAGTPWTVARTGLHDAAAACLTVLGDVLAGDSSPLGRLIPMATRARSVTALIDLVTKEDEERLQLILAGYDQADSCGRAAMLEARARGRGEPVRTPGDVADPVEGVAHRLLVMPATEVRRLIGQVLTDWASRAWPQLEAEALPVIERTIEMSQAGNTGDFNMFTRGVEFSAWPAGVGRAVLYPTFVGDPWVTHLIDGDRLIIVFPTGDDVAAPRGRADAWRRLRDAWGQPDAMELMARLRTGQPVLEELADGLGTDPRTLRPQLARLRAAGVIAVDAITHRYRVREEGSIAFGTLLDGMLRARADSVSHS